MPWRSTAAATSTMNAPAGPPIWNRLPPSAEIRKPPMMAVKSPRDRDRHGQRQGDDGDREPGHRVGTERREPVALAQHGDELGDEQRCKARLAVE